MQQSGTWREKLSDAAGWVLAGCALLAVIIGTALLTSFDNGIAAGLVFVGLMAGGFLAIAVHELGHALGAALVGWRLWIFSVLGIVSRRGHGLGLSTKYSHDVGGYVLASPMDAAHDTRWRSIIVSTGGPLASVLTGPLFIYWIASEPREGWWETSIGQGVLVAMLAFGAASAASAAFTIWPTRDRNGRPNDGAMILDAMSKRDPSRDVRGVSWAWGLFEYGVEPAAWPRWMHESVTRSATNPWATPLAPLLSFILALDNHDETAARAAAQRNAHDLGRLMRAFVAAYFDNDAQAAETELNGMAVASHEDTVSLLHRFIDMRIKALHSDANAAARARALLLRDLHSDVPRPFWIKLFERHAQ
jgi:hypothetical protein